MAVSVRAGNDETTATALLLHGFGGSGASWSAVPPPHGGGPYRLCAPDLRGHGAAAGRRPVDLDGVLADLEPVLRAAAVDGPVVLGGYSLGGRVALQLAVRAPEAVAGLLLVSTTAGLRGAEERRARRAADAALAARLRDEGLDAFARHWGDLGLWEGDPQAARAAQRAELLAADAEGLGAALVGLSPGRLPALWDALPGLDLPVRVLVGERDARYRAIGERLVVALPRAVATVVPGAGHGLVREAPGAVDAAVRALLPAAAPGLQAG